LYRRLGGPQSRSGHRGFFVGDQNVSEDDLPLSEWLKQNGITKFDHLSDDDGNFIHADDDLMTYGIPTESDIIETMLRKKKIVTKTTLNSLRIQSLQNL
jgi:hypothetical protein